MSAAQGVYKAPLYAFLLNNVNATTASSAINGFISNPYGVTVNGTTDAWSVLQTSLAPVTITASSGTATGVIALSSTAGTGTSVIENLWKKFNPTLTAGTSSFTSCVPVSIILTLPDGTPALYYTLGVTVSGNYPVLSNKGASAYSDSTSTNSAFKNTSASPFTSWNFNHNTRLAFEQSGASPDGIGFEVKFSSTVSGGQSLLESRIVQRQGSSVSSSAGLLGVAVFTN